MFNTLEVVIGLEIHAQVTSNTKLFSESAASFGAEPNTQVSFLDVAMPGTLPVLNRKCVEQAVKTGLGLNAEINLFSVFDRKSYFYPDLPQGYQISQFSFPIVGKGVVKVDLPNGTHSFVGITRIHLEQDAGKSIHDQFPGETLLDFNRCGIALMEIVTEPDIKSAEQAAAFVKKLQTILRYLGTCDGDMENGSLRCDINISLKKIGSDKLGTRVEVKNLNSIKNIIAAISAEQKRQTEILESGGEIVQETRLFDADLGITRSMRSKEDAVQYRYFPDPDLLPLVLSQKYVDDIRNTLPELPDSKHLRYVQEFGLSEYDARVLVADRHVADYFEHIAKLTDPKLAANWVTVELFGRLKKAGIHLELCKITAEQLAALIMLIIKGVISGKIAKQVFDIMFETGEHPNTIVETHDLKQVVDTKAVEGIVENVLQQYTKEVQLYRAGKSKLLSFFVGQVMSQSKGKANPELVNNLLHKKLSPI